MLFGTRYDHIIYTSMEILALISFKVKYDRPYVLVCWSNIESETKNIAIPTGVL